MCYFGIYIEDSARVSNINLNNILVNTRDTYGGSVQFIYADSADIYNINANNCTFINDINCVFSFTAGCTVNTIMANNIIYKSIKTGNNPGNFLTTYSNLEHLFISNSIFSGLQDFIAWKDTNIYNTTESIKLSNLDLTFQDSTGSLITFYESDTTLLLETKNLTINTTLDSTLHLNHKDIRIRSWDFPFDGTKVNFTPLENDYILHDGTGTLTKGPTWFDGDSLRSLIDDTVIDK